MKKESVLNCEFPELFSFINENKVSVIYIPEFRSFGVPLKNSEAYQEIYFCPWTGKKLPPSVREKYFDILNDLGLEPYEREKIPIEMRSEVWWIKLSI